MHSSSEGPETGLTSRGITVVGLWFNLGLSVSKVSVGWMGNSRALIADGLHSLSDLASDFAVLWGVSKSSRPPDEDHHYGHHRFQALVSLGMAVLLFGGGLLICGEALLSWHKGHRGPTGWMPLALALASIVIKEVLYRLTLAVGRRNNDLAVVANAWHHRSDAYTSMAAAVGIAGAALGGPSWAFLDPLMAVALALFLLDAGRRIGLEAANELVDRAPASDVLARVEAIVSNTPGVRNHHAMRARALSGKIEMDVHIEVDGAISVHEGHEIARDVKYALLASDLGVAHVIVHVEPDGSQQTSTREPRRTDPRSDQ